MRIYIKFISLVPTSTSISLKVVQKCQVCQICVLRENSSYTRYQKTTALQQNEIEK